MPPKECGKRESDKLGYKAKALAGIITSIGVIGTAILYVGSFYFQPLSATTVQNEKYEIKFKEIELKQTKTDECLIEIKTDTRWIKEGISEIKQKLK